MNFIYFYGGFREDSFTKERFVTPLIEAVVYKEPWLAFGSGPRRFFSHFILSPRFNSRFDIPFKASVVNRIIKEASFKDPGPLCLVVNAHFAICFTKSVIKKIKEKYGDIKLVLVFSDKVDYFYNNYANLLPIEELKGLFDKVISYNVEDCEKYLFTKNRPAIRNYKSAVADDDLPNSDLFFVGQNKNRISRILKIFELATRFGLKCDFYVTNVPQKEQKYSGEIKYDHPLTYEEVLKHVRKTKCIVDVVQSGGSGITRRELESICNDKLLLTDNYAIKKTEFYSYEQVIDIDDFADRIEDVRTGFQGHNDFSKKLSYETYFEWLSGVIARDVD